MLLFAVRTGKSRFIESFVKETNYRFNGGDGSNKALIFVSGKITPIKKRDGYILIFNVRLMLFNFSFMKHLLFSVFVKGLKKHGYRGKKPRMLSSVDLFHTLEVVL